MEKLTVGLIRSLKHHIFDGKNLTEQAIEYMMEYTGCERKVYTKDKINSIILEAFCDVIDSVNKPSSLIRTLMDCISFNQFINGDCDIYNNMLCTMLDVQVMEDGEYINGFKQEDFEEEIETLIRSV